MFLDTSYCIDLMREWRRRVKGPATQKLSSLGGVQLQVSVFVLCELHAGAQISVRPDEELKRVELFSELLTPVYPDMAFAVAYGLAEAHLRRTGMRVATMDLLIGVTAAQRGYPLLTRDVEHFRHIPGLVVESY